MQAKFRNRLLLEKVMCYFSYAFGLNQRAQNNDLPGRYFVWGVHVLVEQHWREQVFKPSRVRLCRS